MRILGFLILASPFLGFVIYTIIDGGFIEALKFWLLVIGFFAFMFIGAYLVTK